MYSQYQHIPCYKYKNDDLERNFSRKCTVLCYILEYIFIVQKAQRRISPVLASNMQIPDQVECLVVFACRKQSQDLFVSLLFVQYLHKYSICNTKQYITRQNTLSFIFLELITMFTLVPGVHVFDKVI